MEKLPHEVYEYVLRETDKTQWDKEDFKHFPDILWLIEENISLDNLSETHKEICFRNGYLEIIPHIDFDKNNTKYCSYAAHNGHLKCLIYAHENGYAWDEKTCSYASSQGNLNCLRYAHENGCPWDTFTCLFPAGYGRLECLRYAHEHGCPWEKYTCESAALHGRLECLRYAHENGCPWDEFTCFNAVLCGRLICLHP